MRIYYEANGAAAVLKTVSKKTTWERNGTEYENWHDDANQRKTVRVCVIDKKGSDPTHGCRSRTF